MTFKPTVNFNPSIENLLTQEIREEKRKKKEENNQNF